MNRIQELLVAGLIAAVVTGAIAGVVIWQITGTQREFVAQQFDAQSAKIQSVGDEIAKTASDLKRLDGALKTTEATLREVKDQVSLVGTRTGIAQLNSLVEAANKTLADIKQATAPDQAKDRVESALAPLDAKLESATKVLTPLADKLDAANKTLAPLADKLDAANKTLAALQAKLGEKLDDKTRDEALTRIETALAGVRDTIAKRPPDPALAEANSKLDEALKSLAALRETADALKGSGTDTAKLDEAAKSLATVKESLDAIKSRADAEAAKLEAAAKSIAALDASVKQGFAEGRAKQADVMKAVTEAAPPPQPAEPKQDLVVFYVAMSGDAPAAAASAAPASTTPASTATPGLTPTVPPPFVVRFEKLGKVDDQGQTKLIVGRVRTLIEGHSGCTIAVAGHADTFGGDRKNYELSKRRANEVADELKAAFAGESVSITRTQWGERRLKEWTPDGTAHEANRRVDIRVSCEK